jgi:hypothetical protein
MLVRPAPLAKATAQPEHTMIRLVPAWPVLRFSWRTTHSSKTLRPYAVAAFAAAVATAYTTTAFFPPLVAVA